MEKKISFIVPVYNAPIEKLERCIDSICSIRNIAFEIIVVNDGSDEEKSAKYSSLILNYCDIDIVLLHQENKGVSAARNAGIIKATGRYIMFVDSDDVILPEALCTEYNADLVLFNHLFRKGKGKDKQRASVDGDSREVLHSELAWLILQGEHRGACGRLLKRSFLQEKNIFFEEGCVHGEDADFNFLFMTMKPVIQYINKPVYIYYFSTKTAANRWRKHTENILASDKRRFARFMKYLPEVFPEDYGWRQKHLLCKRVDDIYKIAIELCSFGYISDNNKKIITNQISEITLPSTANLKTKYHYRITKSGQWWWMGIIARLRVLYLWVMGI